VRVPDEEEEEEEGASSVVKMDNDGQPGVTT